MIIGLGNPGSEYRDTRHNIGFKVVDLLCARYGLKLKPSRQAKGLYAERKLDAHDLMLFLPLTYMNRSGPAVKRIKEENDVENDRILVVCDDFHLDFGRLRIRAKGSDGGHNGLSSVILALNSDCFPRLRLGIGEPPGKKNAADYVLEEFTQKEKEDIEWLIQDGADCCEEWINHGIQKAMDRFNSKQASG
jgi:PTH1 family peptidyl-tRNA hydrolase